MKRALAIGVLLAPLATGCGGRSAVGGSADMGGADSVGVDGGLAADSGTAPDSGTAADSGSCPDSGWPAARPVCGPGEDETTDDDVFARLTATSWYDEVACNSGDPLPPTCNRLRLSADGTFAWTADSDAIERDLSGGWNFRARDATTGVVCLEDGSVVDFALEQAAPAGGLRWARLGVLSPDEPLAGGGLRADLPDVTPAPLFLDLTAHAWAKTNEMDLFYLPTSFLLRRDGTFDATWRAGECAAGGTFSVVSLMWFEPRFEGSPTPRRTAATCGGAARRRASPLASRGSTRMACSTHSAQRTAIARSTPTNGCSPSRPTTTPR